MSREVSLGSHSYSILPPSLLSHYYGFSEHEAPRQKTNLAAPELRNCVNREVGLGSHSLSHTFFPRL